jgi:hypothetical protein
LIERLESFSLKTLSGENIFVACSLIKGVLNKLESIGRVPTDIDITVLNIMQTSSLDAFNSFFMTIMHYNDSNLGVSKTVDEILTLAETQYKRHLEPGHTHPWKGTGRVGKSTFITEAEVAVELQANAAAAELEKRGAEPPRWNPNTPGNNRGRRGRGGNPATAWKRIPPGAGEPTSKMVDGTTVYWCGTCKYWNTTHTTVQHISRPQAAPQANVAADDSATVTTSSGNSTTGTTIASEAPQDVNGSRVSYYGAVLNRMKMSD